MSAPLPETVPPPGEPTAVAARATHPARLESWLTLVVMLLLLPMYWQLQALADGRDLRYQVQEIAAPLLVQAEDSAEVSAEHAPTPAEVVEAYKATAMHQLLQQAWWQWPLWVGAGLLLLKLSRRPEITPLSGLGLTLALWGLLGAVCTVYLPYTQKRGFYPLETPWLPFALPPWPFAVLMLGGVMLFIQTRQQPQPWPLRQTLSSRWGYAGFVLLTGLGWLMLLDQSATGHWRNRYLALNQQGYLWGAFLLLNLAAMLRVPLGIFLARTYALMMLLADRAGRIKSALLLVVLVVLAFLLLRHQRQFTSELGRLWLIAGTAWFFYLRGDPLHQVARTQGLGGQLRWFAPMLLVGLTLLLAMLITSDMGPLLISLYGAGIFMAAALAAGRVQAGGRVGPALLLAALGVILWAALVTELLFLFGELNSTAAGRLESVHAPLHGMNDQLAIITWFRHATPEWGYGLGAVPWCGLVGSGSCRGVPLQIQSDYTFTALWGLWGGWMAWAVLCFAAFWQYRLIKYHPDVTSGCPSLLAVGPAGGRMVDPQGFISWLGIGWVTLNLCQMAVTVSGNLGLLPLTGVTFPLVSYGLVSLWVNALLLGLCINLSLPLRGAVAPGSVPPSSPTPGPTLGQTSGAHHA